MDTQTKQQLIDSIANNSNGVQHNASQIQTQTIFTWIGAQLGAAAITIAQLNELLTSVSLVAATTYSLYLIYIKFKEQREKKKKSK